MPDLEIRFIPNTDFLQLGKLTVNMYYAIDKNINEFQAINTLVHSINTQKNFIAIGLYDDKILKGFVTGYEGGIDIYYFSGIYLEDKNTEYTKKLIDFSFETIKEMGYKGWEVEANNENIASIVEKYGAKMQHIKYRKEFLNG